MAKSSVAEFIKKIIDLGADALATKIITQMQEELAGIPGTFNVTLIVADDLGGAWSNKAELDYKNRVTCVMSSQDVSWVPGIIWVSEEPSLQKITDELKTCLYRLEYVLRHGKALTLRELLVQEGYAMAHAGCSQPTLNYEDLEYTRGIINPLLDATDMPTHIACLYGDGAAQAFGFTVYGLSQDAGLALALHDFKKRGQ